MGYAWNTDKEATDLSKLLWFLRYTSFGALWDILEMNIERIIKRNEFTLLYTVNLAEDYISLST